MRRGKRQFYNCLVFFWKGFFVFFRWFVNLHFLRDVYFIICTLTPQIKKKKYARLLMGFFFWYLKARTCNSSHTQEPTRRGQRTSLIFRQFDFCRVNELINFLLLLSPMRERCFARFWPKGVPPIFQRIKISRGINTLLRISLHACFFF